MNDDLATHPIDVVTAFAAQRPGHCRQRPRVRLLAVVLVGADVAVLTEGTAHVAGSEEDRARACRPPIEQLLAGMMEVRADARGRGELAGTKLLARHAVNTAIPWTEIAVGEHAVGKLTAKLEQARPFRWSRQRRACADRPPTREENRSKPVELGPKHFLAAFAGVKLSGEGRGDTKLGGAPVLRNVEIPRQRGPDGWIVPNSQCPEIAHRSGSRFSCPSRNSLHAIFARVVFTEDLADLLGKALVHSRLGLAAFFQTWPLAARGGFLCSAHYDPKLCRIGREFKIGIMMDF